MVVTWKYGTEGVLKQDHSFLGVQCLKLLKNRISLSLCYWMTPFSADPGWDIEEGNIHQFVDLFLEWIFSVCYI
jgi:hypothetical protein